jgi:hypothetical protein
MRRNEVRKQPTHCYDSDSSDDINSEISTVKVPPRRQGRPSHIEPAWVKELLKTIEANGGWQELHERRFPLTYHCDLRPSLFGAKNTALRKSVANVKNTWAKDQYKYKKALEENGVSELCRNADKASTGNISNKRGDEAAAMSDADSDIEVESIDDAPSAGAPGSVYTNEHGQKVIIVDTTRPDNNDEFLVYHYHNYEASNGEIFDAVKIVKESVSPEDIHEKCFTGEIIGRNKLRLSISRTTTLNRTHPEDFKQAFTNVGLKCQKFFLWYDVLRKKHGKPTKNNGHLRYVVLEFPGLTLRQQPGPAVVSKPFITQGEFSSKKARRQTIEKQYESFNVCWDVAVGKINTTAEDVDTSGADLLADIFHGP